MLVEFEIPMKLLRGLVSRAAVIGLFWGVFTLQAGKDVAEAARLAATKAARGEAAAKLDKAKAPDELQKEKEKLEKLKEDIKSLLGDSKEYQQGLSEATVGIFKGLQPDVLLHQHPQSKTLLLLMLQVPSCCKLEGPDVQSSCSCFCCWFSYALLC